MGQIRMTPDSMRGRANEYRTEAEHVGEVISKMDTLLQNLQAEWEGAAATSYAEKFGELRPSFVKAQELWQDDLLVELEARSDSEPRFVVIGMIGSRHYSAVITYRDGRIRLISVRRSREKEVALYEGD